jgi:hypothetical protein
MTPLPDKYPFGLDDDRLEATLEDLLDPSKWPGYDEVERLLPELRAALLSVGIQERSRRESGRLARLSLLLAGLALLIALASFVVALVK